MSQNVSQNVYQFVPMQDFKSSTSDIDWDKSIPDINEQLCNKYGFTSEEKALINNKIKPME